MVFSSNVFLLYFLPIFLIVYHIVPVKVKNYVILTASIFFYSWGAPKFIFLVLASLVVNYFVVQQIYNSKNKRNKKIFLVISVIINVGLLVFFKYANFFVENVNSILSLFNINAVHWTKIALPIGISFFTFQSLTYTVDVYRKVHAPLSKLTDYLLYILMFPQLIAGPIVRFSTIADQITDRRNEENTNNRLTGIYRFVLGLSKKVLIANVLGKEVDAIFSMNMAEIDTTLAWTGIIAYSFQIYFDFSGYSDMAIGIGKIIGFKFPENFNNPYVSKSITEFWRRWHMTLGAWMKDYLYIPLGGNKVKTRGRLFFNLWIVFLISGLWHGAAWNFVIWGAFHGFFLILDRLFLLKILNRIGKFPAMIFTYLVTLTGWVLFRIENINDSFLIITKMFSFNTVQSSYTLGKEFLVTMIIAFVFSFITAFRYGLKLEKFFYYTDYGKRGYVFMYLVSVILLLICLSYITSFGFNPFIYYRF